MKLWQKQLDEALEEPVEFGHNFSIDKKSISNFIRYLEKLGSKIEVSDYDTLELVLPTELSLRVKALLYILDNPNVPPSTENSWNKHKLCLSWRA